MNIKKNPPTSEYNSPLLSTGSFYRRYIAVYIESRLPKYRGICTLTMGMMVAGGNYDRKILARKYLALLERIITNNEN